MARRKIKVAVCGAYGRMGRSVTGAVSAQEDMKVTGAFDMAGVGEDAGTAAGIGPIGVGITDSIAGLIETGRPDVIVDFTTAEGFGKRAMQALRAGVRLVVGTTGIDTRSLKRIEKYANEKNWEWLLRRISRSALCL